MFAEWDRGWYGESPQKKSAKFRIFPDLCRMAGEGVSNLEPNHMQTHYRTLGIYVMLFEFWSIGNHPTFPRKNITWLVVWSIFYFSIQLGISSSNWRTHVFQRGRYTTNQITQDRPKTIPKSTQQSSQQSLNIPKSTQKSTQIIQQTSNSH